MAQSSVQGGATAVDEGPLSFALCVVTSPVVRLEQSPSQGCEVGAVTQKPLALGTSPAPGWGHGSQPGQWPVYLDT